MFSAFSQSWEMIRQSYSVLRRQKTLVLFPILSALACVVVVVSFVAPIFLFPDLLQGLTREAEVGQQPGVQQNVVWLLVTFVFYFINYFIIVFFNSALAACAVIHFKGGEATLADGLAAAGRRLPQIAAWALLAATIGMILRAIEERSQWVGKLVAGLLGVLWTLATYLVVPVLAVEGTGPLAAVKRSTELLRRTWGEGLAGGISLGLLGLLLMLPGLLFIGFGAVLASQSLGFLAAGIVLAVVYWVATAIILSTLRQIYIAALYLYAAEGQLPMGYSRELVQGAFRTKKGG
jgi:hypothetical protein